MGFCLDSAIWGLYNCLTFFFTSLSMLFLTWKGLQLNLVSSPFFFRERTYQDRRDTPFCAILIALSMKRLIQLCCLCVPKWCQGWLIMFVWSQCSSTPSLRQVLWLCRYCHTSLHSLVIEKFLGRPGPLPRHFLPSVRNPLGYFLINFVYALSMRLIRSELIFSLEPGFRIECHGIPDHAYIVGLWKHDNYWGIQISCISFSWYSVYVSNV